MRRVIPHPQLILILIIALTGLLTPVACRRAAPTPLPVVQTMTRIADATPTDTAGATDRIVPAATPAPAPTITPTPTPVPTLPPQKIGLALPAWLLAQEAVFFDSLRAEYADLYLLPVGNSNDARSLLDAGKARLALLTDPDGAGSDLLRQTPFLLTGHLATSPLNLSLTDLRALFAGQSEIARRVVIVGDGAIERELLDLDTLRPDALSAADWPAARDALLADRSAVALLPWAYVTPRLRLHPIDDYAFGPHSLTDGYPLVQRWRLSGDAAAHPALWQALTQHLRAEFTPPVSLIAVGDVMLARYVSASIAERGVDYPFAAVAAQLGAADLAFANLETPLSDGGSLSTDGIAFRADPSVADGLSNAGFDVLSLANNHIGDYGGDALDETIRLLAEHGIAPVGAGANEAAAREPQILKIRGLKIAFLARNGIPYGAPAAGPDTPGAAWFDPAQTLADIRAASVQADLVVLSLHWGSEYSYAISDEQRAFVQEAVAAGADLILGHHPHNAQTLDLGDDWLAAYSLGNFVFDQDWSVESSQGLALRLLLDESGLRAIEPLAVYVANRQARILNWNEGKSLLAETLELARGLPSAAPAPAPDAAWAFQTGGRVTGLASADLDGDGGRELIAVTGSLEQPGTVHALRGGERLWQFQTEARVNDVCIADLDSDSRDEILLATGALDQPSHIHALDEDGAQLWRYTVEAKVEDVTSADLDGDGRRNEVLAAEWGSFDDTIYALNPGGSLRWVYETSGTPNRLLTAGEQIFIGGDGLYALDRSGALLWKQDSEDKAYVNNLLAADLDGDGQAEIIAGMRYPAPALLARNTAGELRWSQPLASSATALAAADLDGDGRFEIIVGTADGTVTALTADGATRWQAALPGAVNRLAAADLNGDGAIEVIVTAGDDFTPGGAAILASDGSPLLWHADSSAVTALYVGRLESEWPEIVIGTGSGWVYPLDWSSALPAVALPTPTATPTPAPTPAATGIYRPTQVEYRITVDLDYWGHSLQAREQVIFTNTLGLPLPDLLFNIPPNYSAGVFALSSLAVNGAAADYDLAGTSLRVPLPRALPPGQAVTLEMAFSIAPPYMRVGSIFGGGSVGYSEKAFNAGNWHPVLAPYHADEGWLETPWHPVGDPYVTDMGAYVVEINTTPEVTVVGPGALEGWPDEGRWRFTISAARCFAFAASHRYESSTETAYGVTVDSYYYPEHQVTGQLALANAAAALRLFSDLYGPYPYPDLRIAETDFSGGQEFSGFMLFGSGTHQGYLDAGGGPRTILFTLIPHETAHQWWYSVVGSDQAREPWLDEAFAKYSEQLFYEWLYPVHADWRWGWMGMAGRSPASLEVTIYDYSNEHLYKDRAYLTGALFLAQLRDALGDEAFFDLIQAHYNQGAKRITTTGEFLALLLQYDNGQIQSIVDLYFSQW